MIATEDGTLALLSRRERQVGVLVARGMTNKAIADSLCISPHTVKEYISRLIVGLSVTNRIQVALWIQARPKAVTGLAVPATLVELSAEVSV